MFFKCKRHLEGTVTIFCHDLGTKQTLRVIGIGIPLLLMGFCEVYYSPNSRRLNYKFREQEWKAAVLRLQQGNPKPDLKIRSFIIFAYRFTTHEHTHTHLQRVLNLPLLKLLKYLRYC